jgi:hypothetical protein
MRTLILCLVLVASGVSARATTLVPVDLGELSRDAQAIVRGRVVSLDAQWTEDRGTIETIVTLEVESYLKGALGPTLRFRTPGGDLGRYRSIVVGAPEFMLDEHVVVFVGARGPAIPYVLGLSQGVFRLARGNAGGDWMVTSPIPSAPANRAAPIVRGDASRQPVPLGEFEQRVRALAAGAR